MPPFAFLSIKLSEPWVFRDLKGSVPLQKAMALCSSRRLFSVSSLSPPVHPSPEIPLLHLSTTLSPVAELSALQTHPLINRVIQSFQSFPSHRKIRADPDAGLSSYFICFPPAYRLW